MSACTSVRNAMTPVYTRSSIAWKRAAGMRHRSTSGCCKIARRSATPRAILSCEDRRCMNAPARPVLSSVRLALIPAKAMAIQKSPSTAANALNRATSTHTRTLIERRSVSRIFLRDAVFSQKTFSASHFSPMKQTHKLVLSLIAFAVSAVALIAKPIPGPKGGRILTTDAPHAEFFVEKDRTVVVSFYDKALKPMALSGQVVNATAEAKSGKVKLDFVEKNGALVSTAPLPEGDDYTVVVQIRNNANARPKNHRVTFHDEICDECKRSEYACICDDAGKEDAHDHGKKK